MFPLLFLHFAWNFKTFLLSLQHHFRTNPKLIKSMKKLMMIAALMLATMSANAQGMFVKPMVGGTLATITGDYTDNTKFKLGLVAGAEFGYMVAPQFGITAGALVSMQGAGYKDTDHIKDYTATTTYLNIPVLANYYIIPGLAVKAGIQPGFLLSAKTKGSEKISGSWEDYEYTGTDGYKKLDISIPLGLSYEFSDFVIDARYNLGISNIVDDIVENSNYTNKNSVIMLTVGYKIPF